ncbi:SDR family NAD(P)-dependent oxidoreductase [Acetobacter sacchari]|uniref:SDR family NAD(P)-dependent oxidoreductase n=1 Tax=Acetobacter sacchari TaxID=2661687 RepID=A0ABS3LTC5_9PROT|nr:SDR family NAD(P)-dependent oxidoreductase [Acetobacter sacchari]
MTDFSPLLIPGRVAVITGAAAGIGAAAARHFSRLGMRLCLFDRDREALSALSTELSVAGPTEMVVGDVTSDGDLRRLSDTAYSVFGEIAILMNNAGIIAGAGPWDDVPAWRHQLEVNFFSILSAQTIFVPRMITQNNPAAVINLGSKEGITTPPGNAAYSVAKAGVKVLTEQLSHELRQIAGGRVTAHLFVPGYTWTPMNEALKSKGTAKPHEAWTAEELIAYFVARLRKGDFYIICPDGAVTPEIDQRRMRWALDDIIKNRPALSRWHDDWKDQFSTFLLTR